MARKISKSAHGSHANLTPGRELYREVLAGFVRQGSSLSRWCQDQKPKVTRSNAQAALFGHWSGPGAAKLCDRLIEAAGVNGTRSGQAA
jgi:hypothetical protein